MKVYTLHLKNGEVAQYTAEQLDKMDKVYGRCRLTGDELDALIQMKAGIIAIAEACDHLERFMKERRQKRRIMPCVSQIAKAVQDMIDHISARQYISTCNNLERATLTVSSLPVPQCTNMRHSDLSEIVKQATRMCAFDCTKTRDESKSCPLRKAFETIPGMKEAARDAQKVAGNDCPYMIVDA